MIFYADFQCTLQSMSYLVQSRFYIDFSKNPKVVRNCKDICLTPTARPNSRPTRAAETQGPPSIGGAQGPKNKLGAQGPPKIIFNLNIYSLDLSLSI